MMVLVGTKQKPGFCRKAYAWALSAFPDEVSSLEGTSDQEQSEEEANYM